MQTEMKVTGTQVNIQSMMEVGAHFGHQTQKWNPKMAPYIHSSRNGIHIINLGKTVELWERARKFIVEQVSRGSQILFVGTKSQARDIIQEEARRCGAFFVTSRWLGGTLSNFQTIKNSIDRLKKLEDFLKKAADETSGVKLNKKERLSISRDIEKLTLTLGGIRDMKRVPDIMFIIDIAKDEIAVKEAQTLQIPLISLVDTNVDPDAIQFPIPSNDDAVRVIRLFSAAIADAIIEGKAAYNAKGLAPQEKPVMPPQAATPVTEPVVAASV